MNHKPTFACIATVLLIGCGGSGSGTGDSTEQDSSEDEQGEVRVAFQRAVETQGPETFTQPLDEPSIVRIVIRNPSSSFKVIEDYPVPDTVEAVISVPVDTGYEVAGISFEAEAGPFDRNLILKLDKQDGITVEPDTVTQVSMILERPDIIVNAPDSADEGELVSVTFDGDATEFFYRDRLSYHDTPLSINNLDDATQAIDNSFNAPSVDSPTDYYLLLDFLLASEYQKDSEPDPWYFFPDQAADDDPLSITIMPLSDFGDLEVDVQY